MLRKQIKQSLNAFQKSSTTTEVDRLAPSAVEKHGIYHPHQFKSSTSTLPSRSMIRQIASLQNQGFEVSDWVDLTRNITDIIFRESKRRKSCFYKEHRRI